MKSPSMNQGTIYTLLTTIMLVILLFGGFLFSISFNQAAVQPSPSVSGKRYEVPTAGFPAIGSLDAPIVIVEFGDFQCPLCRDFQERTFKSLLRVYPGKVRFVYRQLPLSSIHPQAFPAAEAALCANDQDSFWAYHDRLFENSEQLGPAVYVRIASDLGLDLAAFRSCLEKEKYRSAIQQDADFAESLGVTGTPAFFINGIALIGDQLLEVFKKIIDQELELQAAS